MAVLTPEDVERKIAEHKAEIERHQAAIWQLNKEKQAWCKHDYYDNSPNTNHGRSKRWMYSNGTWMTRFCHDCGKIDQNPNFRWGADD